MMPNYGTPPVALGPRRGLPGLGRRRPALPRPGRRHRGRPRSATPTRRSSRPCTAQVATARPHLQLLRHRARGRAGRAAASSCSAPPGRAGLLLQLRRRGQRGRVQARAARTGRPQRIVAADGAFHGRTMGALALTGKPPSGSRSRRCCPARSTSCRTATSRRCEPRSTSDTAAVFVEPIQGEGGVVPPPAGYLAAAREISDAAGALLVLDEVQTGIGRTGAGSPTSPARRAPRRRHPGQGPRRRPADRRLHRPRPRRPRCSARRPRHDLRRQPGRLRRRARRARRHRAPTACSTTSPRSVSTLRRGSWRCDHPLVTRSAARGCWLGARPDRAARRPRSTPPPATRVHRQRGRRRRASGSPRRSMLTEAQADEFLAALPGAARRVIAEGATAMTRHFLRDDDLTPAEQPAVLDLADAHEAGRFARDRWPARAGRGDLRQAVDPDPAVLRVGIAELGGHPLVIDARSTPARPRRDRSRTPPGC